MKINAKDVVCSNELLSNKRYLHVRCVYMHLPIPRLRHLYSKQLFQIYTIVRQFRFLFFSTFIIT